MFAAIDVTQEGMVYGQQIIDIVSQFKGKQIITHSSYWVPVFNFTGIKDYKFSPKQTFTLRDFQDMIGKCLKSKKGM